MKGFGLIFNAFVMVGIIYFSSIL